MVHQSHEFGGESSWGVRRFLAPAALLLGAGLAGCATVSTHQDEAVTHSVEVYELTSAFFQTHTFKSQSLRWQTDAGGYRWPAGLTLNARAYMSMLEDWVERRLVFRHDLLYPGAELEQAYELANDLRRDLGDNCRHIPVWADDEQLNLPVSHVSVQVFTDRARMPVPPTDTQPDVLAAIVEENPPYRLVVSTRFAIEPDDEVFARLAAAQTIRYDVCGPVAYATPDEILGLRQVYGWRHR